METVTGLGMYQEFRSLVPGLKVPPHLIHTQALTLGSKGQCFRAARDQPCNSDTNPTQTSLSQSLPWAAGQSIRITERPQ